MFEKLLKNTLPVLALVFAVGAAVDQSIADTSIKGDLGNAAHSTENATKKGAGKVKRGTQKAGKKAGDTGKDVSRKTKKSAHDVSGDVKNG